MAFEFTPPPVESLEPESFTPPPLDSLEPMTDRDSQWLKLNAQREAARIEQDVIDDSSTLRRVVADPAIALAKGVISVPEAAVGLADIVSKGRAGKAMEDAGFKFREAKDILSSYQTAEQQLAQGRVAQAKGFIPTVKALVENPTVAAESIVESLPLMFGGGALSQAALKGIAKIGPKFAAWAAGASAPIIAGAAGEGLVGAGSAAENIRQQSPDRLLTWEQAGYAAASGVGTAAFGALSGKLAQKLGLEDIQTALAKGGTSAAQKAALPKFKTVIAGALQEGALEELPQSAQEQMFSNLALGKPWDEGLAEAAAQGFVAGAAMGGGVQLLSGRGQPTAGPTPPQLPAQPAPVAPIAPAAPPTAAPAATLPTTAPAAPVVQPVTAQSIQRATPRTSNERRQEALNEARAEAEGLLFFDAEDQSHWISAKANSLWYKKALAETPAFSEERKQAREAVGFFENRSGEEPPLKSVPLDRVTIRSRPSDSAAGTTSSITSDSLYEIPDKPGWITATSKSGKATFVNIREQHPVVQAAIQDRLSKDKESDREVPTQKASPVESRQADSTSSPQVGASAETRTIYINGSPVQVPVKKRTAPEPAAKSTETAPAESQSVTRVKGWVKSAVDVGGLPIAPVSVVATGSDLPAQIQSDFKAHNHDIEEVFAVYWGGKIYLVADKLGSESEAASALRHETAHWLLDQPAGKKLLREFVANHLDAAMIADLEAKGYVRGKQESDANFASRIANEFIAHHAANKGEIWQQLVLAIREFLVRSGLKNATAEDSAQAILRQLSTPKPRRPTPKPRRVAITPEAQAAAPKRQQKNLPIGDGFSVRTELDSPNRKQYLIVGQLGRPVGRIDLVKDSSGIWRPTPGAGLEINDQLARGKGLVQKSLQALLPELKAIGSSGISEDVTSQSAARMWQRMGATIENVAPGNIGEAKAYVLRSQSPKRQQALPEAFTLPEPSEGRPYEAAGPVAVQSKKLTRFPQVPEPEQFNSVEELLKFRRQRIDEQIALYQREIGLTKQEAERLNDLMEMEASTKKFEQQIGPEKAARLNWFFEESDWNKRGGPFQSWETDRRLNPEALVGETDKDTLVANIRSAVERGVEAKTNSDTFLSAAIAAKRLQEVGGTLSDVARHLDRYTTQNSSSQGDKAEFFKSLGAKVNRFLASQGIELPKGDIQRTPRLETQPPYAPQEQAPVEVLRNQPPGTPAQVAEGKPREVSESAGEGAKEARDKSKPEQMDQNEFYAWSKARARRMQDESGSAAPFMQETQQQYFRKAFKESLPINADSYDAALKRDVKRYLKLPEGYIRKGELYVFEKAIPEAAAPTVAAKEPWEMTREEYKKTLGGRTNQMTGEPFYPEGWPLSDEAVVAWRKLVDEDRRLLKAKLPTSKDLLDWKGGTHLAVIQQAISEGKPVPPAVLADYPELKQAAGKAAKQPEPAYISPEEVDTVGKTKSGQPVRREVVETLPSEAAGEGAPEKRDKSKPEQMTPEEWGYWYEESVSPKLKSRKVKLGQGQPKDVRAFNAGLNDFAERARLAQPLSASAVDTYGIKLPPGYIREGDLYVYRPEVKPEEGRGETAKAFSPDDALIMHSPHSGEDVDVTYRGPLGDKSVVWTGRSQMSVPTGWLRRKGEPLKQPENARPADQPSSTPISAVPVLPEPDSGLAEQKEMPKTKAGLIEELVGKKPEGFSSSAVDSRVRWDNKMRTFSKFTKAELESRVLQKRELDQKLKEKSDRWLAIGPLVKAQMQAAGNSWRSEAKRIAVDHGISEYVTFPENSLGEEAARLSGLLAEKGYSKLKQAPSVDVGEQQVLDEISKLKSVTGPLSQSERIDLNELRLSAQNKKLSRLSQAYLENLEERAKEKLEQGRGVIPKEGVGSIYQMERGGETKWLVQEGEKRGFGDSIFDTEQEAVAESQREATRREQRAESLRRLDAEKSAEAKAKAEREDLGTFTDGMSPMKRGSVVKQLTARFRYLGKEMSRRDIIRELVNQGRKVEVEEGQRVLSNDKGEYLGEKVLTKAGLDYAEHLIQERDAQMSLGQTPTARPAPSLSKMQVEQAVRELFDGNTPPNFQVTHNYGKTFKAKFPLGIFDGTTLTAKSSQAPTAGEPVAVVLKDGTKVGTYDPNTGGFAFTASAPAAGAELFFQQARTVRGWYDADTGTIWLNAAYLRSPQEARAVFIEEAFHAIQNDKAVQAELSRLIASLTPEQLSTARAAYGNISEEQLRMEAVADILERQQLTQEQRGMLARLWDAVLGAVQRLYGKFTGKVFTERDAQDVLAKALKAAAVGKRSNVGGQTIYAANAVVVPPNRRPDSFSLTAHHGTPHQVDKFSTAKIGTGEGAQVYGWGLYFAENPKVAEEYKARLSESLLLLDGRPIEEFQKTGRENLIFGHARQYVADGHDTKQKLLAKLESAAAYEKERGNRYFSPQDYQEVIDAVKSANEITTKTEGHTYTVTLNVEPEDLLDWDKPLSEQSEKVRKAIQSDAELDSPMLPMWEVIKGKTASELYSRLERDIPGGSPSASRHLSRLGIKGIRYLDQGSRPFVRYSQAVRPVKSGGPFEVYRTDTGATTSGPFNTREDAQARADAEQGQQTYNYVIFNEDDIRITHQNGQRISAAEAQEEQSLGSPQNQLDQQYFEAIQRGDMREVQALVDEAARGAGYDSPEVYRGDRIGKTAFTGREDRSNFIQGNVFFSSEPAIAAGYAPNNRRWKQGYVRAKDLQQSDGLYRAKLNISNPLIVDARGEGWDSVPFNGESIQIDDLAVKARELGHDGLIVKDVADQYGTSDQYAVFNPSQIKSSDPITYDDSGNIIPLSQRFQQESPDIRYSLGERVKGPQEDNLGAKYTDAIRASESSGSRQDFLRGTDAQIEAAIIGADVSAMVRQGVGYEGRPSGAVRGLRSGTESAAGKAVPKVRVFISTDALDSTARKNSEILASRIFPAESGTQAAALSDMDEGDFVLTAARRTPFFVTIFSAEGEKSPLARTQTLADGTPAIIFNTTNLGKFNLQDAATAAQFDGVLSEELIHVAAISVTSQKEAQDVWASLSDKEKKAAERSYNRRRNKDALSDYELGHEYLRMVIQERMFGKTTEQVELRITEPVKKFLRKLLNFIKEAFGKKPENDIARQLVSRIESALNGETPRQYSIIPSGTSLATNISQSDATEVQGRAIEPSVIAAAGRAVADLGRQTVEEYEQAGRELEGLAYESKAFRQARSELNNLVSLHEGRLRQYPQDRVTDDMRANIRDGVSIENGQIVVGDELVTKLAQMGVQARPELVRAMQAEVHFEQQARRLVDNLGKLATLKELKDYYTRIKAPADEILNLDKLIAAKEKVVANLTPVTINRGNDQQSVGERASEITRANASKVELQAKRDALNLEPVQEFFGKGITELRDLSERAKAAADLTRALMDSTTSISEVARLGEIYDKWAGFDATVKDALKKGTLTDEQRVSVLTSLQQSFNEFDEAKFRMDDLLGSEEQGLLKNIRQAEADIADAKVTSGLADILVADALKAAKGEMGLTGTVGDAANIANLEASTGAITTLAMNLGRTIDQNRWLYDFLVAPGSMPAFGANVAQSLGISEAALREILKVVQQSPSLASAIVTLTDDAAAKLATSPPLQMQSIAQLATSGNALAMTLAANLTSQIVQQANAQGTKANAARQSAARQLAQSVLRLRTLQQGQALFNQTANSPAFQQLRSAVAAGASEAQKMVVLGPTGPVLRGFKSAAKEYQPELKIDVDGNPLELSKTREKVWKYLQNAEQYVADYESAAAAYAANPANPSPSQLGFDVADYNGLKFAIENDIWPMFLNMGDMDDAARAAQYLTPVLVRKFMKLPAFLGQIFLQYEQLGKMVGGFAGNIFRQQIAKYKRGYLNGKRVDSQFQDLPRLQSAAMQSHNIKNEDTYRRIFNEMAHYGRLFGTPLRVGFKLPVSNQVVTKADMEFLKRTLAFMERLRREVNEVDPVTGVRYMRGGKEVTRKGAYVGDVGMSRHLNRGATRFIADVTNAYAATPKGFTATTDLSASSQDGVAAYWNQHLNTLKDHVLNSLRTDRSFKQSAEMAAAEKKIAARWLAGNMDQVNSVQDLVDLIAAEIPTTSGKNPLDTAREGLNNELLQYVAHAERIKKERAEDNAKTSGLSIALSSENEYTKPAAYLELPSEYYDYGAVSSVDRITAQARANHSTLIDFANSIRLAITELRNRLDRLKLATTDKERDLILENYKGNQQEMEDVLELLTASLKNFEDSYRAGGPDLVPTRLGQKLLKATVGSVLAKVEIGIRNLSQGQLQVFTNLRAMNYMSARLAAWKALSNVPRGLINTGYLVARNIAGFADRRLGRDPQFQRTLKGAVDVLADGIFKAAQLALLKPRVGAENVRASFERVNALGFDTSNDWWETAKQAWTESGQFRNQMEEDEAMKSRASMAKHFMERIANTGLDTINAFVRGSVLESTDTNINALSLGLAGNQEQRLEEVAMVFGKRLTDAGITRIDPTDKRAILQPSEWLPSLNQQTATNSLGEIRKFLESSASSEGFSLERNLLQYYQDKMAGRPAKIFNQRTFDAVQQSMIAENNAALPTNRASAGQASTLWRTLLTLQGYPADAFLKLLRISTGGSRERNKVLQAASKISLALGIAALAIILQGAGDAGAELWKRKIQGKRADRPTPLDADFYTDPDHLNRAMGRYLMMSAYYLGNAMEAAYGWVDGRTTIDPTQRVFAIATASQIIRDIVSGAKIAKKGGSVSDALEPLRKSMMRLTFAAPELEYLLGRERDNTEAARRGITENAKAKGFDLPSPGFSGTVGLTNIKRKAISQAVSDMDIAKRKGDTEGYNKAKAEAQKQIAELEAYYLKQRLDAGDSPEVAAKTAKASVWGDYQENNPVTAALGGKRPTAEQYKQLVESSTGERGEVIRQGIKAWQDGAQALFGKPGNITKEDVAENRPGGTVKEPSYGRVSLTGGVSSRMRSVGTALPRGRRAKIRRVSLTGRRRRISPLRGRRKKIRRVRLTA